MAVSSSKRNRGESSLSCTTLSLWYLLLHVHANQQLASLAVAVCLYHSRFLRLDSQSPTKRPPSLHQCLLFFASFSSVSVCWSVFLIFAAVVGGCCSFVFCLLSPLPFAHSVQLEGCHPFFSTEVIVYQSRLSLVSLDFTCTQDSLLLNRHGNGRILPCLCNDYFLLPPMSESSLSSDAAVSLSPFLRIGNYVVVFNFSVFFWPTPFSIAGAVV